jgi:hypothetical protein
VVDSERKYFLGWIVSFGAPSKIRLIPGDIFSSPMIISAE